MGVSVGSDLEKLIALQDIDLKIQQMMARLDALPAKREQIEAKFNEFSSEYNETCQKLENARAEHKQLESELEKIQRSHEKYKEDLMKVRNEKEYTTCLREIDSAKKSASQLETQILKLLEDIDQFEKEIAKYFPDIENRRREVDQQIAEIEVEIGKGQGEIDNVREERNSIAKTIPKQLFANYERIAKLRSGIALAEVENGCCSACRMKIRPQVFSEIRKGDQLIICENCSRYLFYRAPVENAAVSD